MSRSHSTSRWLDRQNKDQYVKKAKQLGLRSRAGFKLQQIQQKYRLVKSGDCVIDLGAAPGGWSEQLIKWVGQSGQVLAVDCLPMKPHFIQGDALCPQVIDQIHSKLGKRGVHWIFSDLAPNMTGQAAVDMPRSLVLADLAFELSNSVLHSGGGILLKLFEGAGVSEFLASLKHRFEKVNRLKPDASRSDSREFYVLAMGFSSQTELN